MCLDIPRGAHILAFLTIIFLKLFHRGKSAVNLKQLYSSPPHKDSPTATQVSSNFKAAWETKEMKEMTVSHLMVIWMFFSLKNVSQNRWIFVCQFPN